MAIVINEYLVEVGARKLAQQAFPGVAWSALEPEMRTKFCSDYREAFNEMSEAHDGREGRYHLDTVVYQRGDEWVLETTGTINDTFLTIRRTEPLSTPVEEVPELPSWKGHDELENGQDNDLDAEVEKSVNEDLDDDPGLIPGY